MSEEDRYLDPAQNPMIRKAPDGEPGQDDVDYLAPMKDLSQKEEEKKDDAGELRDFVVKKMDEVGSSGGCITLVAEDGGDVPLFSVTRTAAGELIVTTPEGTEKPLEALTLLERKILRHELEK